jgi:hypothetical protein
MLGYAPSQSSVRSDSRSLATFEYPGLMTVTVAGSDTATKSPSVIEQPLETLVDYSALQRIMPFLSCSGHSLQQEQWAYKIILDHINRKAFVQQVSREVGVTGAPSCTLDMRVDPELRCGDGKIRRTYIMAFRRAMGYEDENDLEPCFGHRAYPKTQRFVIAIHKYRAMLPHSSVLGLKDNLEGPCCQTYLKALKRVYEEI